MHIRKQITYALAAGCAALIALLWLAFSLAAGSFRIADTSFAQAQQESGKAAAPAQSGNSLVGAAAAALGASSSPATLQVVGGASASTPAPAPDDRTAIPF